MEKRINKNGRPYYYENGRGIVNNKEGARAYIKENLNHFTKSQVEKLTEDEKRAYRAQSRPRYKGRFISKQQERLLRVELDELGEKLPKGAEISAVFGNNDPFDFIKGKSVTKSVNTEIDTKTATGFQMEQDILNSLKRGGDFELRIKGKTFEGLDAISKLRELNEKAARKDGFYIHFVKTEINKNLQEKTYIDLSDSEVIISKKK